MQLQITSRNILREIILKTSTPLLLPAGADGAFLVVLGVVVALQDQGAAAAKVFPLHVDVTLQVSGENALDQLGQEGVFVRAQVELGQLGGQSGGPAGERGAHGEKNRGDDRVIKVKGSGCSPGVKVIEVLEVLLRVCVPSLVQFLLHVGLWTHARLDSGRRPEGQQRSVPAAGSVPAVCSQRCSG